MSESEFLEMLAELSDALLNLELSGEESDRRDRMIISISDLSTLITRNALKEGTVALENAVERLNRVTERTNQEREDMERTTRNLQAVASVLGAIAGVIRFV